MATPSKELGLEQQPAGSLQDPAEGSVPPSRPLESPRDKFFRKIREQPLVPIGSLLTCGALIAASNHLRRGDRNKFQKALRWRVGFQGLTVLGALAGSFYYNRVATAPAPALPSSASSTDPSVPTVPGTDSTAGTEAAATTTRQPNVWQQTRADERAAKQKAGFEKRLAAAKAREEEDEDRALEEALLDSRGARRRV